MLTSPSHKTVVLNKPRLQDELAWQPLVQWAGAIAQDLQGVLASLTGYRMLADEMGSTPTMDCSLDGILAAGKKSLQLFDRKGYGELPEYLLDQVVRNLCDRMVASLRNRSFTQQALRDTVVR